MTVRFAGLLYKKKVWKKTPRKRDENDVHNSPKMAYSKMKTDFHVNFNVHSGLLVNSIDILVNISGLLFSITSLKVNPNVF